VSEVSEQEDAERSGRSVDVAGLVFTLSVVRAHVDDPARTRKKLIAPRSRRKNLSRSTAPSWKRCTSFASSISQTLDLRWFADVGTLGYIRHCAMPWRCPACQTEVRHDSVSGPPRTGEKYRCHVCRLDLLFDSVTNHMVVGPLEVDDHVPGQKTTLIVPPVKSRRKRRSWHFPRVLRARGANSIDAWQSFL